MRDKTDIQPGGSSVEADGVGTETSIVEDTMPETRRKKLRWGLGLGLLVVTGIIALLYTSTLPKSGMEGTNVADNVPVPVVDDYQVGGGVIVTASLAGWTLEDGALEVLASNEDDNGFVTLDLFPGTDGIEILQHPGRWTMSAPRLVLSNGSLYEAWGYRPIYVSDAGAAQNIVYAPTMVDLAADEVTTEYLAAFLTDAGIVEGDPRYARAQEAFAAAKYGGAGVAGSPGADGIAGGSGAESTEGSVNAEGQVWHEGWTEWVDTSGYISVWVRSGHYETICNDCGADITEGPNEHLEATVHSNWSSVYVDTSYWKDKWISSGYWVYHESYWE